MNASISTLSQLCGQLIMGGFVGTELPETYGRALAEGTRAGAILFRRNLSDIAQLTALNGSIARADACGPPLLIGVDQEGGRVTRLPEPFFTPPPMRKLGLAGDISLTEAVAAQLALELSSLGFNLNFAPVLDVHSNPANPIIGDRAFGSDVETVSVHGTAFIRALQSHGVHACAKHFPGHGDTALDSHLALPTVARGGTELHALEVPPFEAAVQSGVASMMTAHVVYPALDPKVPATFSRLIATELLREQLGFEGVLFSDDLEMAAVAEHQTIEESATMALEAGCDILLICKHEALQARAHAALLDRAGRDQRFRARCEEAYERGLRMRSAQTANAPQQTAFEELAAGSMRANLQERLAAGPGVSA